MRLDFNLLWVEDQPNEVKSTIVRLEKKFGAEGFLLKPSFCKSVDDLEQFVANDVFVDEVDLILVDWELGGGSYGEEAIEAIRARIAYKDIIFYSGRTDTQNLRDLTKDVQGIFITNRDELVAEVFGVFQSLVKKALDLDHIRGIVMGATSDIEQTVRECLSLAHEVADGEGRSSIAVDVFEILDAKMPSLEKRITALKESGKVPDVLAEHLTFTAQDGARVLSRILEMEQFKPQKEFRVSVTTYMQTVTKTRNILGHKVLSPEGKPIAIAGETPADTISFDDMKKFRSTLIELRERFRSLRDTLSAAKSR